MIRKASSLRRDRVYGPIDYLLTAVYSCLAAYSAGRAVGSENAAYMLCGMIVVGTALSFLIQHLGNNHRVLRVDGYLYFAVALAAWVYRAELNALVPDQVFAERQLQVAGFLCWMLAFGSFFTWRDGTLLFQAVPGIALFGMVGVFDTFQPSTFLFYVFLTCLATLFSRAHLRSMIEQAEASGYKAMLASEEAAEEGPKGKKPQARLAAILQGPWRWVAGPEWALVSAVGIVIFSLIGAPLLQSSFKGVSGIIRVIPPPLMTPRAPDVMAESGEGDTVRVGFGRPNVGTRELLRARLDQERYLRAHTYNTYTGRGWRERWPVRTRGGSVQLLSLREIQNGLAVGFWVEVLDPHLGSVPVPGDLIATGRLPLGYVTERRDGTLRINSLSGAVPRIAGRVRVAPQGAVPRNAPNDLPPAMAPYADTTGLSLRVINWARQAAGGAANDYEKARAVKRAIESTARYNLQVGVTPAGEDPIEHFLFQSKEGYCDLFASAMVAGARAVGVPARYATGFYPMSKTVDNEGNYILLEKDSHAWAELFFSGVGWVVFDATEFAEQVPGGERGGATRRGPWYDEPWFRTAVDVAIVAVILLGAAIAGVLYWRSRHITAVSVKDVGREYSRFVSLLERASKKRRMPHHTPDEYLALAAPWLGGSLPSAEQLNRRFVSALYSDQTLTPQELESLRKQTGALREQLRRSAPRPGSLR